MFFHYTSICATFIIFQFAYQGNFILEASIFDARSQNFTWNLSRNDFSK